MLAALVFGACVALPAQNCTVTSYGQGCGPVATGIVTPNGNTARFDFTVTAAPRSRVLLVVGVNETATPLPFTSCLLLTELAFTQQHRTDAAGQWLFSHAIAGGGTFTGLRPDPVHPVRSRLERRPVALPEQRPLDGLRRRLLTAARRRRRSAGVGPSAPS